MPSVRLDYAGRAALRYWEALIRSSCLLAAFALLGTSCSASPKTTPAAHVRPVPARPAPRVAKRPGRVEDATCARAKERVPTCDKPCMPSVLWRQSYGDEDGYQPSLLQLFGDSEGNFIVAGQTGRGPTYLGGRPLYAHGPKGVGEAFVAKYASSGEHLWSRELFPSSAKERMRGARSSIRSLAVGAGGDIHVLASRVGSADDGAYLVSLSRDGRHIIPHRVERGLPTLVTLSEREGIPVAVGVDVASAETEATISHYRIARDGHLTGEAIGTVPQPPGTVNTQRARFHPLGLLWTAVLDRRSAGAKAGVFTCPLVSAERQTRGFVRTSSTPTAHECPSAVTEVLTAGMRTDGTILWTRSFSVPNYEPGSEPIAADPAGNTYFVGAFAGTAHFGPHSACAAELPEGYVDDYFGAVEWDSACECMRDYADVFLVKLDPAGDPRWVRRIGGFMRDRVGDVVIDSAGNVVVAVGTTPQPDFRVPRRSALPPVWSVHAFDPEGAHLWTYRLETTVAPVLGAGAEGAVVVAEGVRTPPGIRLTALQSWPRMPPVKAR